MLLLEPALDSSPPTSTSCIAGIMASATVAGPQFISFKLLSFQYIVLFYYYLLLVSYCA
jgi:hypothetical protein